MDMEVTERDRAKVTVEDVQGRADTRRIAIDRVGIKDIRHPVLREGARKPKSNEELQ